MFDRKIFKKKPTYFPPGNIGTNNLIDPDKRKHLKGEIYLVHCRGHNTIMLIFYFKGFYDQHQHLLSKNYYHR